MRKSLFAKLCLVLLGLPALARAQNSSGVESEIKKLLQAHVMRENNGERANLASNPKWKVSIILQSTIKIDSISEDKFSAKATLSYFQIGILSADGSYQDTRRVLVDESGKSTVTATPVIFNAELNYRNGKWEITAPPDTLLPQVSFVRAKNHLETLAKNSTDPILKAQAERGIVALNNRK